MLRPVLLCPTIGPTLGRWFGCPPQLGLLCTCFEATIISLPFSADNPDTASVFSMWFPSCSPAAVVMSTRLGSPTIAQLCNVCLGFLALLLGHSILRMAGPS